MNPARSLRGVRSFFADLHADAEAVRVCRGTSCTLLGADALRARLEREGPCRPVHCLGYCDRSPAALHPDGRVESGSGTTRIRCDAPLAIVTERIGRGDHSELARAREAGVYSGLERALRESPGELLTAVERSGLRGRGGAGFPTGRKWRDCADAPSSGRVVVANGDEGDPGSFVDRLLLELDPHAVLEGLCLAGFAVGAEQGIVFVRSEYPEALLRMERAVADARAAGLLGTNLLGSRLRFDVRVASGAGSYVCGEETALLAALEGQRGEVRLRPPYPTRSGLDGRPTLVDNVETLVNVPWIARHGAERFVAIGSAESPGTLGLCLNAGFAEPGLVEVELGTSLARVIERAAGDSERLAAVLLGGPMGSVLLPDEWDVPLCYTELRNRGIELGHGGLVAVPRGTDPGALAAHWLEFMADESCGKCVPCRIGSQRALELARAADAAQQGRLLDLLELISATSLCAFGQRIPVPVAKLLTTLLREGSTE